MNSPVMQGLNLSTPPYVKNAKLIAWVADMAALLPLIGKERALERLNRTA